MACLGSEFKSLCSLSVDWLLRKEKILGVIEIIRRRHSVLCLSIGNHTWISFDTWISATTRPVLPSRNFRKLFQSRPCVTNVMSRHRTLSIAWLVSSSVLFHVGDLLYTIYSVYGTLFKGFWPILTNLTNMDELLVFYSWSYLDLEDVDHPKTDYFSPPTPLKHIWHGWSPWELQLGPCF